MTSEVSPKLMNKNGKNVRRKMKDTMNKNRDELVDFMKQNKCFKH